MISRRGFRNFIFVLARHPVRAAAIAWWQTTGRKKRAHERLKAAFATLPVAYRCWIADSAAVDARTLAGTSSSYQNPIAIHLHYEADSDPYAFRAALASVRRQSHKNWHLWLTTSIPLPKFSEDARITVLETLYATRAQGFNAVIRQVPSGYLLPLEGGCQLPRHSLRAFAAAICVDPRGAAEIFYGDQDEILSDKHSGNPWLKPEWDPDMVLSQDYVSSACILQITAARRVLEAGLSDQAVDVYDLILRMTRHACCSVKHVQRITISTPRDVWQNSSRDRLDAIRTNLAQERADAGEIRSGPFGTSVVEWPIAPDPPLVSIIVPTRDKVELLRTCVGGVLSNTSYPNVELIIADNGSAEPATHRFLEGITGDPRVRVVSWPHAYNYSAINNFASGFARGEYLCLLNNDIEIIDSDWLTALMRQAARPQVGAVGARLLYPDRSIQHAGVVVGLGNAAGHAHRGLPEGEAGYFANALVTRRTCAVTAACLVVARKKFDSVGGLDAESLSIAYNDVDLCLKLRAAGWHNIYVPQSVLIHHESKSRGSDFAPDHHARYLGELNVLQERWATRDFQDPTHHPILDRASEIYRPFYG